MSKVTKLIIGKLNLMQVSGFKAQVHILSKAAPTFSNSSAAVPGSQEEKKRKEEKRKEKKRKEKKRKEKRGEGREGEGRD